jgi:hypothetical protein
MTEHQTMNTVIHAAFRRDLGRFDTALAGFPAGSEERAEELGRAWTNLADQLHHHHEDEETIFWPVMREFGADEPLMAALEAEHAAMIGALTTAATSMTALSHEPSRENLAAARQDVAALRTVVDDHLAHEERDLEPVAAANLDSPRMKAAEVAVRKAHKGGAGTFFAWLLDDADESARAALRGFIPTPVLFVISRVGGRAYNRRIATVWD